MLKDGRIAILDAAGITIFESEKTNGIRRRKCCKLSRKFQKVGKGGQFYGLFTSRSNGGEIGTYTNCIENGHNLVWVQNTTKPAKEMKIRQAKINFAHYNDEYCIGAPRPSIR